MAGVHKVTHLCFLLCSGLLCITQYSFISFNPRPGGQLTVYTGPTRQPIRTPRGKQMTAIINADHVMHVPDQKDGLPVELRYHRAHALKADNAYPAIYLALVQDYLGDGWKESFPPQDWVEDTALFWSLDIESALQEGSDKGPRKKFKTEQENVLVRYFNKTLADTLDALAYEKPHASTHEKKERLCKRLNEMKGAMNEVCQAASNKKTSLARKRFLKEYLLTNKNFASS